MSFGVKKMMDKNVIKKRCLRTISPKKQALMKQIGEACQRAGETCYAVGGIARDCALGHKVKDIDLVCSNAENVINALGKIREERGLSKMGVSPLTRQLTRVVRIDGEDIDFAQARKETYSGRSIKPENIEKATIEEDVLRRDFTVNTLMLDLSPENFLNVVDLTGRGLKDLGNRILVTPRDPEVTFKDDPSRMLRLVRFMKCKNFDAPDEIQRVVKKTAREIHRVPWEKFHEELVRGSGCDSYFGTLDELGLMNEIMPEVTAMKNVEQTPEHHKYDVYNHTMKVVAHLPKHLKFTGLFHDIGKPVVLEREGSFHKHEVESARVMRQVMKRLKFSNAEIARNERVVLRHMDVLHLINEPNLTDRAIRRFIARNDEIVDDLLTFARADVIASGVHADRDLEEISQLSSRINNLREEGAGKVETLSVSGHDVMQVLNIPEGPEVGLILMELREKVELGEVKNNRSHLLEILKNINIDR